MSWIRTLRKSVKRRQKSGFKNFTSSKKLEAFSRAMMLDKNKTESEKIFYRLLLKYGIRFSTNRPVSLDGDGTKYRIADFYLPKKKVLVEIDGEYHRRKSIKEYDMKKDSSVGFRTFRYTNEEIEKDGEFIVSELKRLGF